MKNTLVLVISLFAANLVLANETAKQEGLTLAAAELQSKAAWVETEEEAQKRINDDLEEKNQALLDKLNAQLEQKLEAKTQNDFAF
jgi:basic membrane lipoprotein Med (substrate-binding protein (PBP1-ABC) superfamily)